ncbi:MAG TPA: lysophospholipid acyltransferase family protein [Pyrinomonadaceae bacterium]|nr:lysophospholipid acyltransferase family protein [Pyrinomonadaceae bacterium]
MAKRGRLQTLLEYTLARAVLSGLGILPRKLAVAVGRSLGRIGYLLFSDLRRTGSRNLNIAFPDVSQGERKRMLRGCFDNLGRMLGEFSQLSRITPDQFRQIVDCEGLDHLRSAQARGQGVILFTGHLGAWEFTSFALSAFGLPFSFMVRRLDNELIERMIDKVRQRFGNRTLDKNAVSRQALRALNEGGTLGMLPDVNMLAREGVFVDFFGTPASTTSMLAKLALRTGAALVPIYAPWDKQRQRFLLQLEPPLRVERTGDEAEDVQRLTAAVMASIENVVRRYPEQWLWIHKRWKTRPPGEPELY